MLMLEEAAAFLKAKPYKNDPFFVSKDIESKKFLEKHGFPEQLIQKKRVAS